MEQSADAYNRKDNCSDEENVEATTSNAVVNDPRQEVHNVNDLKTLDFNSADAVRQAIKALIKDKKRLQGEDGEHCSLTENKDAKAIVKNDPQLNGETVIVNVRKVNKNHRKSDKENKNNEATTSNARVKDPSREAYNVNDLKINEFNSADEMRQAMETLLKDRNRLHCEYGEYCSLTENMDAKIIVKKDRQHEQINSEKVIVNASEVNNNHCEDIDKENENNQATISNADANNSNQEVQNVNDMNIIDLDSADKMRRKMLLLLQDQSRLPNEDGACCSLIENGDAKVTVKNDRQHKQPNSERVVVNVGKVNNKHTRQTRKRPGRPPKPGPSKKYKKTKESTQIFYRGKLSDLIFMHRKYRYEKSSDNDSVLSF